MRKLRNQHVEGTSVALNAPGSALPAGTTPCPLAVNVVSLGFSAVNEAEHHVCKGLGPARKIPKQTASHLRLSADRTRPRLCPAVKQASGSLQRKAWRARVPPEPRLQAQGPSEIAPPVSRLPSLMLLVDARTKPRGAGMRGGDLARVCTRRSPFQEGVGRMGLGGDGGWGGGATTGVGQRGAAGEVAK